MRLRCRAISKISISENGWWIMKICKIQGRYVAAYRGQTVIAPTFPEALTRMLELIGVAA